ncbi:ion channel TACAN isoform X2 [Pygocentrus nattereri]|uniref:ion channel TACAN isoform X2 n=1 Tax=Pygocentrus nattereri TaxID=42514 RepID=UPI0018912C08|nr:ion channel TACAN isoform X2 [Pygocentrus nattereri]
MSSQLTEALQEWERLDKDFQQIQESHRLYLQKLDEVSKTQSSFTASIARHRKYLKDLSQSLNKCSKGLTGENAKKVERIKGHIQQRPNIFSEMESFLPKKNGIYLSLVLGSVNVNLLSKQSKAAYKDEYEKFKLGVTVILLLLTFICQFLVTYRIKGWWVFHHYISTFLSGVMLTWPDGELYQMFRSQFLTYCLYQGFVQCLQYYYQSGCLYRLKALGERHNLDLTVEGFQSWMWRGLTFLLPFLFFGHFWQLFNSVTLFRMARLPQCKEWQVLICGFSFLVLFAGNFFTTLAVVRHKRKTKNQGKSKGL